jgi:hypothetical protein
MMRELTLSKLVGARKQILIQYLQQVVSMQLGTMGLWIQKITGGKCKYGLSYPFESNWFTRKW